MTEKNTAPSFWQNPTLKLGGLAAILAATIGLGTFWYQGSFTGAASANPYTAHDSITPATPPPKTYPDFSQPPQLAGDRSIKGTPGMPSTIQDLTPQQQVQQHEMLNNVYRQHVKDLKNAPKKDTPTNITGTWTASKDLRFELTQQGKNVVLQEFHPDYKLVSVGQGEISGGVVSIDYIDLLGIPGKAILRINATGERISGTFSNLKTGKTEVRQLKKK